MQRYFSKNILPALKKKATDPEKKEGFLPISAQINWYITA